jgi:hypothetical protein
MKSFVVRVYSAPGGRTPDAAMAGIVEDPETGRQLAFHDPQELWAALSGAPRGDAEPPDCKPTDDTDDSASRER